MTAKRTPKVAKAELTERMTAKRTPKVAKAELTEPRAMVIVALIGIIPALVTGFVTWYVGKPGRDVSKAVMQVSYAANRLDNSLRAPSGFQKRTYPNLGFGFIAPKSWQVEDYTTRFGVPDIDVIQRYTDKKAAIGIKYRLMPVQPNYVHDHAQEVANQVRVWEKDDPNLQVTDSTISGFPAKRFDYMKPTGERMGKIQRY